MPPQNGRAKERLDKPSTWTVSAAMYKMATSAPWAEARSRRPSGSSLVLRKYTQLIPQATTGAQIHCASAATLSTRSNVHVTGDLREEAAQRPDAARRPC